MWRKILVSSVILLHFLFCGGCSSAKQEIASSIDFADSDSIEWQTLTHVPIPYPKDFSVDDTRLYLLALNDGKWLHTFDKSSGKKLQDKVYMSKYATDVANACSMSIDNSSDGSIGIFDIDSRDLKYFSKDFKYISTFTPDKLVNDMIGISDSCVISTIPVIKEGTWQKRNAYEMIDPRNGDILSKYIWEGDTANLHAISQRELTYSPNTKHFATISNHCGLLEIFDISNRKFNKTFSNDYLPYLMYNTDGITMEKAYNYGFKCLTSDDLYIYVAYSEAKDDGPVNTIGVWSWDGKPKKKFTTDRDIIRIAINPKDQKLYGVTIDNDGQYSISYIELYSSRIK